MDDSEIPKVAEALAALAVGASEGTNLLSSLCGAGLAVVPAAIERLAGSALKVYRARLERKANTWLQLVAHLMELGSSEEAAKVVEESIDEPWAHESVVEGVRAVLDDIDTAALPALAKIIARRLKSRTAPNKRDKRAIRMLCELEAESYEALVSVVRIIGKSEETSQLRMKVEIKAPRGKDTLLVLVRSKAPPFPEVASVTEPAPAGWEGAFSFLKRHGFGEDGSSGVQTGRHFMIVDLRDVTYLKEILL